MQEPKIIVVRYNELGTIVKDDKTGVEYVLPINYGPYSYKDLEKLNDVEYRLANEDEKIKFITESYRLGEVVKVHTIGDYQILENKGEDGEKVFSVYLNYKPIGKSYYSLDYALLGAICAKYVGTCTDLASHLWRMLKS